MLIQATQSVAISIRVKLRSRATGEAVVLTTTLVSALTIQLSKSGASTFTTITPTATIIGSGSNGILNLALTSSHTDTLGIANLRIAETTIFTEDVFIDVVAVNRNDSAAFGLSALTYPTGTVVTDAGNLAATFKTDLIQVTTDYWKDAYIVITSGSLIGQVKKITGFDGTTKFITVLSPGFTGIPAAGVTFILINK